MTNSFLACTETPLKYSATAEELNDVYTCDNCTVRLTSPLAGTGEIEKVAQGLAFESPQTTLELNGLHYSIIKCVLTFPAMHHIAVPGLDPNEIRAELHVRFRGRDPKDTGRYATLVLPIKEGDGPSATFFTYLGYITAPTASVKRPRLDGLLPDTSLLMYTGVDISNRVPGTAVCAVDADSRLNKVTYLVALKPVVMRTTDLARLKREAGVTGDRTFPTVTGIPDTKKKLLTRIPSIASAPAPTSDGYKPTAQLKCRPLDIGRDIRGDKVYVGGPGTYRSLKDEMADAADPLRGMGVPEASFDISRVESIMAIVIGVLIGVVVIAWIFYYLFSKMKNYNKVNAIWDFLKLN